MLFGEALGKSAYKIAQKMGNKKSIGKCALAVGDAVSAVLGEEVARCYRGHAYKWLIPLKCATKKYWNFKGCTSNTKNLKAGTLVVWDRQEAHPYGHIEIADGFGHLCSDFIRDDFRPLYVNNPAKIIPQIFEPVEFNVADPDEAPNNVPYDVIVTCDVLNIRKSTRIDGQVTARAKRGDVLTVWAIKHGKERIWGKNNKGYFALEYTKCI